MSLHIVHCTICDVQQLNEVIRTVDILCISILQFGACDKHFLRLKRSMKCKKLFL